MRLSEDMRKCVVYLGFARPDNEDEIDPKGTGFLVYGGTPGSCYLVTVAHVAKNFIDGPFAIRLNQRNGNGRVVRIDSAEWFLHPKDESVDVAVTPFEAPQWADVAWLPTDSFVRPESLSGDDAGFGTGDLVYVVGIFQLLYGKKRNMPAVHTGHIALIPGDEELQVRDWRALDPKKAPLVKADAYLVEAQTLPGSSGSPVFIRQSIEIPEPIDPDSFRSSFGSPIGTAHSRRVWLLGLWHGTWFGDPSEVISFPMMENKKVPFGMGIVIPGWRIIETLYRAELVEMRIKAKEKQDFDNAPEPTSMDSVPQIPNVPFREALKRVWSSPPQPKIALKKPQKKR